MKNVEVQRGALIHNFEALNAVRLQASPDAQFEIVPSKFLNGRDLVS